MFNNAGSKLKVLAKWLFLLNVLAGIILCITLFSKTSGFSILFIPSGLLIGTVSCLLLYAFGEICEDIKTIVAYSSSFSASQYEKFNKQQSSFATSVFDDDELPNL